MNTSSDAQPGHQVHWVPTLFPWLPWTFLHGAPCHGNANQTVFFLEADTFRGSAASQQNNVLICFVGQMWRLYDKTFTSGRKLAREMDFPVECRWRYSFLACACNIAMSSPRVDTCGFNPSERTNTFTPSLHPRLSWSILYSWKGKHESFYVSYIPQQHLFHLVLPSCCPSCLPLFCLLWTGQWSLYLPSCLPKNHWNIFQHRFLSGGCITCLSNPVALTALCQKHVCFLQR